MPAEDNSIHPFQVGFPEAELTELRRRVNATRWPECETVTSRSSTLRSPSRSVSLLAWPSRLGSAVIRPALTPAPVAWPGMDAHTTSRLVQITSPIRPKLAATSTTGGPAAAAAHDHAQAHVRVMATSPARGSRIIALPQRNLPGKERETLQTLASASVWLSAVWGGPVTAQRWRTCPCCQLIARCGSSGRGVSKTSTTPVAHGRYGHWSRCRVSAAPGRADSADSREPGLPPAEPALHTRITRCGARCLACPPHPRSPQMLRPRAHNRRICSIRRDQSIA
jgi:hypothetical protein